jgi:flagellar secretion chaperone FliS
VNAKYSYREAAVWGARPVQLVIILYEQAIEDLRRAMIALEKNDIEGRTREINHATSVIGQLHGSLDMEHGGDVARNLANFYNVVRGCLIEVQRTQSAKLLEQQISHLVLLHEAWLEVERATAASKPPSGGSTPSVGNDFPAETSLADWQA